MHIYHIPHTCTYIKQIALEFTRPEIEVVHKGILPCRFCPILQLSKRQNAETAWQNAFVDHLPDFRPGKLKRSLLHHICVYTYYMIIYIHGCSAQTHIPMYCRHTYRCLAVHRHTYRCMQRTDTHTGVLQCTDTHTGVLQCTDTHTGVLQCTDTHTGVWQCTDTHTGVLGAELDGLGLGLPLASGGMMDKTSGFLYLTRGSDAWIGVPDTRVEMELICGFGG